MPTVGPGAPVPLRTALPRGPWIPVGGMITSGTGRLPSRDGDELGVEDVFGPCGVLAGARGGPGHVRAGALAEGGCCGGGEDDLHGARDGVDGDVALRADRGGHFDECGL